MALTLDRCPLCEGPSARRFARGDWWIRDCSACGHRFAEIAPLPDHVERVYADAYFEGGGAGYPGYLAEGPLLRRSGQRYAKLLARHVPLGSALDVGCAAGFWLAGMADCGWRAHGIEPNAVMAAYAREVLGLDVTHGAWERLPDDDVRYDVVSLIQVVAHFVDVRRALTLAARRVRSGGVLLIESWNRDSRTARWTGEGWHEYSPPSVLHWFSTDSLARLTAEMGLIEIARGRPSKRISSAHARALIGRDRSGVLARLASKALDAMPGEWTLPYPGDDVFWLLLRRPRSSPISRQR